MDKTSKIEDTNKHLNIITRELKLIKLNMTAYFQLDIFDSKLRDLHGLFSRVERNVIDLEGMQSNDRSEERTGTTFKCLVE